MKNFREMEENKKLLKKKKDFFFLNLEQGWVEMATRN